MELIHSYNIWTQYTYIYLVQIIFNIICMYVFKNNYDSYVFE